MREDSESWKDKLVSIKTQLLKIIGDIDGLESESQAILYLYKKKIIDRRTMRWQMRQIQDIKQALEERKREAELRINTQEYRSMRLTTVEEAARTIQGQVDSLSFERKTDLVDLFVDRVIVDKNGRIQLQMVIPGFPQNTCHATQHH